MEKHPELVSLGKAIRSIRVAKGYSQENFALEAGLDRTYYAGVERGERNISALNLIKLANSLGVNVGDFFSVDEKQLSK